MGDIYSDESVLCSADPDFKMLLERMELVGSGESRVGENSWHRQGRRGVSGRAIVSKNAASLRAECGYTPVRPSTEDTRLQDLRDRASAHRLKQLTAIRHRVFCGVLGFESNVRVPFHPDYTFSSGILPEPKKTVKKVPKIRGGGGGGGGVEKCFSSLVVAAQGGGGDVGGGLPLYTRGAGGGAAGTVFKRRADVTKTVDWCPGKMSRLARRCVQRGDGG